MRGREMLDTIENLNPAYIKAAAEKPKAKKAGWFKWGAMVACLCLVVVGAIFIHNAEPAYQIALSYNEVSSVMSGGTPVSAQTATVEATAEEVSELLGYDINSCIPPAMKSYVFKYTTIRNTGTNEILGVIVTGREAGDDATRPGIWVEVSFGTKPMVDYDFEGEKMVYSTINGIEICATVVPETTKTTASGENKTKPAVYAATFEQRVNFYYIESRGTLEQVIFDELVCSLIKTTG